jgi:hypothetical protein
MLCSLCAGAVLALTRRLLACLLPAPLLRFPAEPQAGYANSTLALIDLLPCRPAAAPTLLR